MQDDRSQDVWNRWDITYRDVVVLDGENQLVGTVNLSNNSLAQDSTWNELKGLLLGAAGESADAEDTASQSDTGL